MNEKIETHLLQKRFMRSVFELYRDIFTVCLKNMSSMVTLVDRPTKVVILYAKKLTNIFKNFKEKKNNKTK